MTHHLWQRLFRRPRIIAENVQPQVILPMPLDPAPIVVPPPPAPILPTAFLSFDVEALPGRSDREPVDSLIWGKLGGGEYGIRRIMGILDQYHIVGNFMIDISLADMFGETPTRRIIDAILTAGHEVHLHQHSENVLRQWGVHPNRKAIGHNELDGEWTKRVISHAAFRFRQFTGADAVMFRCGAYRFNRQTIEALGEVGIRAASNLRESCDPFRWPNGVIELPVDMSPEPLSMAWSKIEGTFDRQSWKTIKTINYVMHSWSLTRRDPDGIHRQHAPDYEERLHQICTLVSTKAQCRGYSTVTVDGLTMDTTWDRVPISPPLVTLLPSAPPCPICNAAVATGQWSDDRCPSCAARTRHRQLQVVFARVGNPFAGHSVLVCHANLVERATFLHGATQVTNFDVRPVAYCDLQMDIQDMSRIPNGSVERFLAIHVLNHVQDDDRALAEIYRVLTVDGLAVLTVPYRDTNTTETCSDPAEHYGTEALQHFGVGTWRRYSRDAFVRQLERWFTVTTEPATDPRTGETDLVFFARKARERTL